jgi:hypothetical protein
VYNHFICQQQHYFWEQGTCGRNIGTIEKCFQCKSSRESWRLSWMQSYKERNWILDWSKRIAEYLIGRMKELLSGRVFDSPSSERFVVDRIIENKISNNEQKLYKSGVGSLLYLVKHSRPDLSNAVRELSKTMDEANNKHWKALLRAIKYVKQTKNYRLNLTPNLEKAEKMSWKCSVTLIIVLIRKQEGAWQDMLYFWMEHP